ncbi:MAG: prepilin-type N-terminal cleavage/methylation domain-containing protein [Patescibacteria group bacterium]|nr:prepilin-type N-terminal cleavage/methylation domain-containing protein [Patescibacteria group bacterium]MDP6756311.1 prepilin-type N-terminal cleavage/methylation domain-containing protein [Patescibacteria group bacterium]
MKKYINKLNALTLIELITVIAIIGILATISAGFIKIYQPNIQLIGANRTLKANIEHARSQTVAQQQTFGIHFSISQDTYELRKLGATIETYSLPQSITFSSIGPFTDDFVSFNKAGAASESGSIVLQNIRGDTKTVTINPSGYVQSN